MANLAITAAEVLPTALTQRRAGTAGAAISAGDVVYLDPVTQTYKLFDGNDTGANTYDPCIALNSAAAGQPLGVAVGGDLTIGATAAAVTGTVYAAGIIAGKMMPVADLASGNRVTIIGVGKASNKLALILANSGVTP